MNTEPNKNNFDIEAKAFDLINEDDYLISDVKPSEWAEQNRVMTTQVSNFTGPFDYDLTPYLREIVNCLLPSHPAREIAIMKGAQLGFSAGVLENGIGWIMKENPGNILLAARDEGLVKKMMDKRVDQMIESCGIRHLIRPNVIRAKGQRTGDTSLEKEFSGGSLEAFSIQKPERMRQVSMKYGFLDDFEAAPVSKDAGDAASLFRTRFKSFGDSKKIMWISTPEVMQTSNINPLYLQGDQRKYFVPCPCCGDYITFEWKTTGHNGRHAGIVYKLDDDGDLISGSVLYKCQSCGDTFSEGHKAEMNLKGKWKPTAKQKDPTFFSYHINALYAPDGMDDWEAYAKEYLEACPPQGKISIPKLKTFRNTGLGLPWEERGNAPKVTRLATNTREYEIGTVPRELSIDEGNGEIVLLTCVCDLNGLEDDARLDYEVVAWSESGASYSVDHGSVGTFVPLENEKKKKGQIIEEREKWTYNLKEEKSVWTVYEEIISKVYESHTGGDAYNVGVAGVDTGFFTNFAYSFIDYANTELGIYTVGLKGKGKHSYRKIDATTRIFSESNEHINCFGIEENQIKDELAALINLRWSEAGGNAQPNGFMNFPSPIKGKYTMKDFFSQFESEHKILKTDPQGKEVGFMWTKRNNKVMNHFWDVRVYNLAVKEILVYQVCKEIGVEKPNWYSYCQYITG